MSEKPAASVAGPVRSRALQVEQERAAGRRRPGGAGGWGGHVGAVRAADGARAEAARGRGRGVAQEAGHAVEDVAPLEEAAEDLRVAAVHPLAAELGGVVARDDGEVVLELRAPERLVHVGREEEGVAEAEGRDEAHRRVGRDVRRRGRARPLLAPVGEVELVDLRRRERREEVDVEGVNLRGALVAVGRVAVGRHVEGLVLVLRVVEVVREREVVVRVQLPVDLAEDGGVADGALDGQTLLLIARRAEEAEEREALAVGVRVDERLVGQDGRRGDGAGGVAHLLGEVGARQVLEDLLVGDEEEGLVAS